MSFTSTQPMSIKNKIVIFGTNDFAELAHYYIANDTNFEVVGFTSHQSYIKDKYYKPKNSTKMYSVVPFENINQHYPPDEVLLFAPMTGVKMNNVRKSVYLEGKQKGYEYYSYISSKATVNNNEIGENCFILEDNTLQPFTTIGNNVVLWSGNHIGHHSVIRDNCFIASHVVISGFCDIGENSFIGVNATLANNVILGRDNWIGPHHVIMKNTEAGALYKTEQPAPAKISTTRFFKIKE